MPISRFLHLAAASFVTVSLAFANTPANAWGRVGHAIIATRAEAQLTPAARRQLQPLLAALGARSLADIASWADDRRTRENARWHFDDMPGDTCVYQRQRDCPGDQCLTEQVKKQITILADPRSDTITKSSALIFVTHLAGGDSSQPLHSGLSSDKGGNTYQLQFRGTSSNLHRVWDSALIMAITDTSSDDQAVASMLEELDRTTPSRRPVVTLRPEDWVQESCTIVHMPGFYPDHVVSPQYVAWARPIIERQLVLGADELAAVLNQALVGRNPVDPQ